jgi:hypothetical protein
MRHVSFEHGLGVGETLWAVFFFAPAAWEELSGSQVDQFIRFRLLPHVPPETEEPPVFIAIFVYCAPEILVASWVIVTGPSVLR